LRKGKKKKKKIDLKKKEQNTKLKNIIINFSVKTLQKYFNCKKYIEISNDIV